MIDPQLILEIAARASTRILEIYNRPDFAVQIKSDNSPLTQADLDSQQIICDGLSRCYPFPIVAEETPVDYDRRREWNTFWLVDPLDGTKDFVARDDEFTVNIGLVEDHRPVFGLVAIPALNLFYYARDGAGAYRVEDGQGVRIFNSNSSAQLVCAESRFHASPQTEEFCRRHGISRMLHYGSSLKLCKMAEGEIDVYPRYAPTMEWDTAAGHCILNESGCRLIDMLTGAPLSYNKESLRNNGFIASRAGLDLSCRSAV